MRDTLAHYLRHPGRFPWSFALWLARRRVRRTLGRLAPAWGVSPFDGWLAPEVMGQQYTHLARDPATLATYFRTRPQPRFFPGTESSPIYKGSSSPFERIWVEKTITQAQRIRDHLFDFDGLGPVPLGASIDWQKDPIAANQRRSENGDGAGNRFDMAWDDTRVVWELNRCHHLVTLGLAYWYTGEEAYAEELVTQMRSWIEGNPTALGVNWASAMEVAIRIVNWVWAFYLVRHSSHLSDEAVHQFLWQVRSHGEYIWHNLERSAVNNNHYLANGVGLLHLGILFPEFKESTRWLQTGKQIVFQETLRQVSTDGVDFEGSIPYHGFVLDLLIPTILLCMYNGVPVPEGVRERVERMMEFVQAYTKPDGTVPQLGDTDDGRLLVLAPRPRNTHLMMLTLGAVVFDRPDFKAASCGWGPEAHWLLGEDGLRRFHRLEAGEQQTAISRGFNAGGIFCMRQGDLHMVIDCADVGTRGRGGHGHNDCLSFELFAFGRTFITDSGTFRYAGPEEERNLFRATAAHNTAMVDDQEMGRFFRKARWRIHDDAKPTLHLWHSDGRVDIFDGSHSGYTRLRNPVQHRRRIVFDKQNQFWVLEDLFIGSGLHRFDMLFHLAPGAVATISDGLLVASSEEPLGARLAIVPLEPKDLEVTVQPGWVSPSYGARTQAQVVRCSFASAAPATARFCLYPLATGQRYEGGDVQKLAGNILERWNHEAIKA